MERRLPISDLFLVALVAAALPTSASESPVAISPGASARFTQVETPCPTFSWASDPEARSVEIMVFRVDELDTVPEPSPRPILTRRLPGPATTWTPALSECFDRGRRYGWMVRTDAGAESRRYSESLFFTVPVTPSAVEIDAALDAIVADPVLRNRAVRRLQRRPPARERVEKVEDFSRDRGSRATLTATSSLTGTPALQAIQGDTSGVTFGVSGIAHSSSGRGVLGEALASSGTTVGIYGRTESAAGYGGYFVNTEGGNLIGANNSDSFTEPEFRVDFAGNVYADGGYNCGAGGTSGIFDANLGNGAVGLNEASLDTCLTDDSPADFAEMMKSAPGATLEPGQVLVLRPDGSLEPSSTPYQGTVAGVRSTRPSYLGNARFTDDPAYVPLALAGIVPVRVTSENGAIAPGDLLVSSSSPGRAMRAGDGAPQGSVVGKALSEQQEEGHGAVWMLVLNR